LFDTFFNDSSVAKTQELAKHYRKLADQENCAFLDAGQVIKVGDIDGVHFDADNHHKLAEAIHAQIKKMVA
jgi:lysophospholipase L1-like esterase